MSDKITIDAIRAAKAQGRKIPMLTVYDYPMARLLDEAGIPILLVGDSLGMVVLGYPDTTLVTMEEMEHHTRAVARAKTAALIVADLPFRSYDAPAQALENARRLMAAGADAVKLEGAALPEVHAIVEARIPVMGHLGMLPQSIHQEGAYRIKGRHENERARLLHEAQALEKAGAFAMVLELVTPPVSAEISKAVSIPTIGIGSGPDCDGQVLVTPDLLGSFPWFRPKFVKPKVDLGAMIREAAKAFASEVTGN